MKMMRWTRSCGGEANELRSKEGEDDEEEEEEKEEEVVVVVKMWLKMSGRSNR